MMKKTLLAAVAAIAMVAGAAAQTMDDTGNNDKQYYWFECSVASIQPQDKNDKDPVYKTNLYFDASDYSFVKVVHTLRSGKEVNRADQYNVNVEITKTKEGASVWMGTHGKNRNLSMGGLFGVLKNGQWIYDEMQFYSGRKGPIIKMHSVCHQI